jgi:hypothetical protein
MRWVLAVALTLVVACGRASVGGGPAAEPKQEGFTVHPMITLATIAAAFVGFLYIREQNANPPKKPE